MGSADAASVAPQGTLVAVVRSLLLDRGTMLAGSDDLLATARDATITLARRDAVAHGIATGDLVAVSGAGTTIELPAVVVDDVLPGVVVLPRNSTTPFVTALADDHGRVHVTVARVAAPVGVGA
jgi:NADH-quinone oxidoreductase subunit G